MREILYGRHAVEETLLAGRRQVFRLMLASGSRLSPSPVLQQAAEARHIAIETLPRPKFDHLTGQVNHQGMAAEVSGYPYSDLEDLWTRRPDASSPILLILDCLQDPQNLGGLIRTAEAVGVQGIVLPRHRAVGVTPAVVNASAGAVEHLRVALVTNLVQAMEKLQGQGFWLVGLEDEPEAQPYHQARLDTPLALVVGSEGQGLGRLVKKSCDYLVKIPMTGQITSLNASIAGSIVLYEAWRQRERQQTTDEH